MLEVNEFGWKQALYEFILCKEAQENLPNRWSFLSFNWPRPSLIYLLEVLFALNYASNAKDVVSDIFRRRCLFAKYFYPSMIFICTAATTTYLVMLFNRNDPPCVAIGSKNCSREVFFLTVRLSARVFLSREWVCCCYCWRGRSTIQLSRIEIDSE